MIDINDLVKLNTFDTLTFRERIIKVVVKVPNLNVAVQRRKTNTLHCVSEQ